MPNNDKEFTHEPIGQSPTGHAVWKQTHIDTGHVLYWSDEVGGVGVNVWDTLTSPETVRFVLDYHERNEK